MIQKYLSRFIFVFVGTLLIAFAAGCGLTPQFSYQGRLTDANGTPLNGTFTITFKLFDASTGGTEIYTETKTVTVNDGLFEVEIGPSDPIGSTLDPESLTQPLWLELTINDGSVTETLSPRQRLYGAPYAFTLMAGSVISGEMDTTIAGASTIKSVLTVQNNYDGDGSNPALPALRVIGETGIELSSPIGVNETGLLTSNLSGINSDLVFSSNDEVKILLDADANSTSNFTVYNGAGQIVFQVQEDGDYYHLGSSTSPATPASVEEPYEGASSQGATDDQVLLASNSITSALLEDFGGGTLINGLVEITLDATFTESLKSNNYYVFVTPLGDCNGLFVAEKSENSFIVKELGNGTSNVSFDYRVVAKLAEKE